MNASILPTALLLVLAALSVYLGGLEGAGALALVAGFLAAFTLLLFRRSRADGRATNPRAVGDRQFVATVVLCAIGLRMAVALAIRAAGANEQIAPDEGTFHDNALWFAAWMRGEVAHPFAWKWTGSTQVGYFAFVGLIYGVLGEFPMIPVLVNCAIGGLCVIPAYVLAARISGRRAGRGAAIAIAFFPSLVLWSTLLIRDAWVLLLLLSCACLAQSLLQRPRVRPLLLLVACLAALATLRSYLLLLVASAIVISFLVAGVKRKGRAILAAAACGLAVLVMMRVGGLGTDYLGDASLRSLALRRQYNALGGEGGIALAGHDLSTVTGVLAYLPTGLAWFLFSPFPWQFAGRQGIAIPEVLIWYACIPFVVGGAIFALRRRRRLALVPLLAGLLLTLLYSLVEGNIGIIFRHRSQALALFLPFAAVGWARWRSRSRVRKDLPWVRLEPDVRALQTASSRARAAVSRH